MLKFTSLSENLDLALAFQAYEQVKNDKMAGWLQVPAVSQTELEQIKQAAEKIQNQSDYLVCIGIGGSYLGHKAVIDALEPQEKVKILYVGNSLSAAALQEVLDEIDGKDFSVNVISKSGTTLEPAAAFEIFKARLEEKYGAEEAKNRIFATTDAEKGTLHDEAVKNGYARFIVPDNIGGRYSVLSAVGLLPLAAAGVDIDALQTGAQNFAAEAAEKSDLSAFQYATLRQQFYQHGSDVEVLASFEPKLATFNEWWKQLFGESEGKDGQGIFPASVIYTTDLHSLGQYLQDGRRNIFETVVKITTPAEVPAGNIKLASAKDLTLPELNKIAEAATIKAHRDGGIPVLEIEIDRLNPENLGALIYFFELSCALSATLQGVNPFDQPGVEAYKSNMRTMMG